MKKNNKKNNRLNFYNFLQKKIIRLLLKLRYLLLAFRKPVKIGFLRLYNEENTIIPCLMSVIGMTDIIVLIYSDIEDSSLELVRRYIKDYRLEKSSLSAATRIKYSPSTLPNTGPAKSNRKTPWPPIMNSATKSAVGWPVSATVSFSK